MRTILITVLLGFHSILSVSQPARGRARDFGIIVGVIPPGKTNAITDVPGVKVGHVTKIQGSTIRTGVTAILPHGGNVFQDKVPGAVFIGNGFGKLAGISQVQELGTIETPIILTSTLNVSTGIDAVIEYTLGLEGNEEVRSVNAVVGETNDGYLNDIRGRHVTKEDVLKAIEIASDNSVIEGNVGAGTGTICFGFKGGIGSSSRVLPKELGGYTVGVLVQTNFGGNLAIDGVPVGEELGKYFFSRILKDKADGSCMIVVATNAPVDARNLERMASRAIMGLAKTGGIGSNGSGDYVIAFSTNEALRIPHQPREPTQTVTLLGNDSMSPLFMAVIEATEEAILNSLFKAETMVSGDGNKVEALPLEDVLKILKKYNSIKK
jgi:D-aminopeptidase